MVINASTASFRNKKDKHLIHGVLFTRSVRRAKCELTLRSYRVEKSNFNFKTDTDTALVNEIGHDAHPVNDTELG